MIYPTVTGVDIGHHSIKAASIRLKKGQFELIACHEVLLPDSVFIDTNSVNLEELTPYLTRLKKMLSFNQKRIAFSVPDSNIISKVIQIDSQLDEKETEFAIAHTFNQQSSFSVEDLNLDYVALNQRGVSSVKTTTYQVFATRKDLIESRQLCFSSGGLTPVLADAHSHSLFALWKKATESYPNKKNWMLIDIGHAQTIFCVMSPNHNFYSKNIMFGAQDLQSKDEQETSESISFEHDTKFIAQLSEHIKRQVTLYSSIHHHKIEGVWVVGGGALLPGLSDCLSYEVSLPTMELNVSSLFFQDKKRVMTMAVNASQYAVALGLALRGVSWLTR
jgi:type IV pilus assembly protein PilM